MSNLYHDDVPVHTHATSDSIPSNNIHSPENSTSTQNIISSPSSSFSESSSETAQSSSLVDMSSTQQPLLPRQSTRIRIPPSYL